MRTVLPQEKPWRNLRTKTENRMRVDRIQRTESLFVAKLPSVKLQAGDRLYVKDSSERLKEFEGILGATMYNVSDGEHPISDETPLASEGQQLAEVVITRGSPLHNRTLNAAQFSSRFGLFALAIHRARSATDLGGDLGAIRLRAGDVLLVQGARDGDTGIARPRVNAGSGCDEPICRIRNAHLWRCGS